MRLTWIAFGPISRSADGTLASETASTRLRCLMPAQLLRERGTEVDILSLSALPEPAELKHRLSADAVIFNKVAAAPHVALARQAKALGARIVFDVCDAHFTHATRGEHYHAMLPLSDALTSNTPFMAEQLKALSPLPVTIIPDPYESAEAPPAFAPAAGALHLCWFGHPTNLDALLHHAPRLAPLGRELELSLTLVTAMAEGVPPMLQNIAHASGLGKIRAAPWSAELQADAIAQADIVLIPSLPGAEKAGKSANRVVETLRRGKLAVAYPLPAYEEFRPHAWIGEDLAEGLRWALAHPDEARARIRSGQSHVAQVYAPAIIAGLWHDALHQPIGTP